MYGAPTPVSARHQSFVREASLSHLEHVAIEQEERHDRRGKVAVRNLVPRRRQDGKPAQTRLRPEALDHKLHWSNQM